MKFIDGEYWLTPSEAALIIGVHSKTLARWTDKGFLHYWNAEKKKLIATKCNIRVQRSRTGYRFFAETDIRELSKQLTKAESEL